MNAFLAQISHFLNDDRTILVLQVLVLLVSLLWLLTGFRFLERDRRPGRRKKDDDRGEH